MHALADASTGRDADRVVAMFRDLFNNDWVLMPVKVLAVLAIFLTFPWSSGTWSTRSWPTCRPGWARWRPAASTACSSWWPTEAGRFHGVLQLVADSIKFVQKESITPRAADKWVFAMAPAVALIPVILVYGFIPYGPDLVPIRSDVGLFVTLALGSVSVIGVLMAAWSSANKYSLMGGIRAAAQLIAYELPLVLAAAAVAMQAGSADLAVIVERQDRVPNALLPWLAVAFVVFFVASLAELTRPPFDMPVADSELVFGHLTEYTGLRFAFSCWPSSPGSCRCRRSRRRCFLAATAAMSCPTASGGWRSRPSC
jgi:NADH:ubiquinone oxidoreductase subunit H